MMHADCFKDQAMNSTSPPVSSHLGSKRQGFKQLQELFGHSKKNWRLDGLAAGERERGNSLSEFEEKKQKIIQQDSLN